MAIDTLQDKLVVVTGAASGIGRSAAIAFAKRGAHIVAADLNAAALELLGKEVAALGVRYCPLVVDVANEEAVKAFAAEAKGRAGVADVLINNAGIVYLGPFLKSDLAHWQRVLAVNIMGVVYGCYHFLPDMLAAGGIRHVLNVSSGAANFPTPLMAAYAASKAAVKGFSEVLRMELAGTGIGVTTVFPGIVNTPIVAVRDNVASVITGEQIERLRSYYQRNGCSPDVVAEDMVRATLERRDYLLTGPSAKLGYYSSRLSPRLTRAMVLRTVRQQAGRSA